VIVYLRLSVSSFAPHLLPQLFQDVQLLVEMFGSALHSRMRNPIQPLVSMAGIVDVSSRTGNRPAAIQRFKVTHYPTQVLGGR
jgi:hypothetical protein